MRFPGRDREPKPIAEPKLLGAEVDHSSAFMYDTYAESKGFRDIFDVWSDPAVRNPLIRQRALATITAPNGTALPFPHPEHNVGGLSGMAYAYREGDRSLRDHLSGRQELAQELGIGILHWLDTADGIGSETLKESFDDYVTVMRQIIPFVDEDTADRLFAHYPMLDRETFWGMEEASGYSPLTTLLRDPAIPRKYKNMGLANWFDIADREQAGTAKPRVEHELAVKQMIEHVELSSYGDSVDTDTTSAIISYLEDSTEQGITYASPYSVSQVAPHIIDDELRFNYVWRHITDQPLEGPKGFSIVDEKDVAILSWATSRAMDQGLAEQAFFDRATELVREYGMRKRERINQAAAEAALRDRLRE